MVRRPLLLLLLAACSKGDPVPVDTDTDVGLPTDTFGGETGAPPVDSDSPPVIEPTEACEVPDGVGLAGVCDLSVGEAEVVVDPVGVHPLVLQVREAGPNTAGGFHGDGLGHRAIGGFHGYDKVALADLGRIEVVAKGLQPTFQLRLGLQVDLDCGHRDLHLLEVAFERVLDTVAESDGRTRYRLPFDAAVWTASEAILDGEEVVLDRTTGTGAVPKSLLGLLERWPGACLRNTDAGFDDLPDHAVASGILLALGSRTTYGQGALWEVTEVVIGDDVHLPPP